MNSGLVFIEEAMRRFLVLVWALLISSAAQAYSAPPPRSHGVLEGFTYRAETQQIRLHGWVLAGADGKRYPTLTLSLLGTDVTARDVAWVDRPDVSAAVEVTGGQLGRGFDMTLSLPPGIPSGVHPLKLQAIYPDGTRAELLSVSQGKPHLVVEAAAKRHAWILAVVLLAVGCLSLIQRRDRQGRSTRTLRRTRHWLEGHRIHTAIAGCFLLLGAAGIHGNSSGMLLEGAFGKSLIEVQGSQSRLFRLRDVRGDEWGVLTPHTLAQLHHVPQFPIINTHVGFSGQNMGVMHMTSVPVWQWAALARPATWGYFVLPLRQAMSWQWQLPFWGCLIALWAMLNVLRPDRRGLNLALSGAFCVAPYAAAWSNWPLYATLFPALAFVLASQILTTTRVWHAALQGVLMGWALASWALVLYPTWIIVIASALLCIGVGWCVDQRARLHVDLAQVFGFLLAAGVALALLGSWWLDSREAIALMRATVYPGERGAMPGGDLSWWWHLRGYNNAEVVLRTPGPATNQSEASSYFFLPLLWLALIGPGLLRPFARRWAVAGCGLFLACYWVYGFVGVPIWLAKYSLWGNMPTVRMDVGLGLVSVILFALVAPDRVAAAERKMGPSVAAAWWSGLIAAGSAALIAWALWVTPVAFMPHGSAVYAVAMAVAGAFISWSMLRGSVGTAVVMLTVVHLLTSLAFNPVSRSPRSIELAAGHRPYVTDPDHPDGFLPTLVLNGDGIGALTFSSVGIPVINGVLHYPHRTFWERMGLAEDEWHKVNRYQHLGFYLMPDVQEPAGYRVIQTGLDQVGVHVHPGRFDFSRTGARRVAVLDDGAAVLEGNRSLKHLGAYRGLHWFAVQAAAR